MLFLRPAFQSKSLLGLILVLAIFGNSLIALSYPLRLGSAIRERKSSGANSPKEVETPRDPLTPINATSADQVITASAREAYGGLPLSFEANQGQTDSQVKFLSRGSGYALFLSPTEAVFSLSRHSKQKTKPESVRSRRVERLSPAETSVVRMKLVNANPVATAEGLDELPGKSNYFIGNDPNKWRTNISSFAKVKHKDVYPGIDMIYYGDRRQLEYDFLVAPGANPRDINLAFSGIQGMRIDARGDLLLRTAGGEIRQHKPVVYQEMGGTKEYVAGRYLLTGRHEVELEVGKYDVTRALVIDPVLVYSTYLGGTGDDYGYGIAVDDFGNAYITGETPSIDFPTMNPLQPQHGGTTIGYTNAFVTKINAAGSALIYSTYLGGSLYDHGYAIAVDHFGSACVTGSTSSTDFPTRNPLQSALSIQFIGGEDAFITKLNPAGSELIFSTYLGGGSFDHPRGIAVDQNNNIYITGDTSDWPTTTDAFQPSTAGHTDAFITKLNSTGTQILYSTFLGGADNDQGLGIAVDSSANAYITGYTESAVDFPTQNALQPTYGGGLTDAFVAKIPTAPVSFVFPADRFDAENGGLAARPFSNFLNWDVTSGAVNLESHPFTNTGLVVNFDGYPPQGAAIETKSPLVLQPITYRLRFNLCIRNSSSTVTVRLGNTFNETFTLNSLGGTGLFSSVVRDIQVAAPTNAKLSFTHNGGLGGGVWLDDVSVFEKAASSYVTFLGGSGDDGRLSGPIAGGIKVDAAGSAYVTGWTDSPDFPRANAIQPVRGGGRDAFISKLNPAGSALVYSTYYGGSADDFGNDIGINGAGEVFVVGNTTSTNFPTKNAIQSTFGGDTQVYGDAFALKLSSTGGEVVYATYLGGAGRDLAEGVAVDSAGNAFVTGHAGSNDFPLQDPLQSQYRNGDAFVAKIPAVLGIGVPDVLGVSPNSVGNAGIVTFRLRGENFGGLTANVKLVRSGSNMILPVHVRIDGPGLIVASFDLTGALSGQWDMVIDFSDGHSSHLTNAITIHVGGQPQIWVDVIGPRQIRVGRKQTFTIVFGNSGDIDAFQVPGWIRAAKRLEPRVLEALAHPPDPPSGVVDWSTVPQQIDDDTDSTIPFLITHLAAHATRTVAVEVNPQTTQPFNVEAWANRPFIANLFGDSQNLGIDCVVDVIAFGIQEALNRFLPVDCVLELGRFVGEQLVDRSLTVLTEGGESKLVSLTQTIYGLASVALTCAGELSPAKWVIATLKIVEDAAKGAAIAAIAEECLAAFLKIVSTSDPNPITVVQSFDPNDKVGSIGAGPPRYITGVEPLRYAIYFENKATASAPAQEVTITDQLDAASLDLDSFSFGTISFGSHRITPGGSVADFTTDVDLRPDKNLIVRVSSKLNKITGLVTWKFFSLDPATGLPTTDPLAGFLPPSVNPPEGDGNVFFTVSSKTNLPTGTVINNSASIVFDENAAIVTPIWSNTLDNSKPASHVQALPATQTSASFNVQWSGTDTGSGIGDYTIYVSDNSGPFTPWLTQTTATQATFASTANHTYSFFSVARDLTGNAEGLKTIAEATTQVVSIAAIASRVTDPYANGVNNVTMTLSGARSASAQTNESGASSFASLPSGNYNITPAKPNYVFTPSSRTFSNLTVDQTGDFVATVIPGAPILVSEATSTRAVALDSVLWFREPLKLDSPIPWGVDHRTRVIFFAMNLDLLAGEGFSIVTADAEDAAHHVYPLSVEYVGRISGRYWLNCVVIRLNDNMGDPGDVLIRITVRGVPSNRVRFGVGHVGGGPTDDLGAVPTPGREP